MTCFLFAAFMPVNPASKSGSMPPATQHHGHFLALATGERLTVQRAFEVDGDLVTLFRRFVRRLPVGALATQAVHHVVDIGRGISAVGRWIFDALVAGQRDLRIDLERGDVLEIRALLVLPGSIRGRQPDAASPGPAPR